MNGKCEYSSVMVNKFRFRDDVGRAPLKSILWRSNGCVDLIKCASGG